MSSSAAFAQNLAHCNFQKLQSRSKAANCRKVPFRMRSMMPSQNQLNSNNLDTSSPKILNVLPAPAEFFSCDGDPSLKYAVAHGERLLVRPFKLYTCDYMLAYFEDKFTDLDPITITHTNILQVASSTLERVIQDAQNTPDGTTSSAAKSLTLLFFIERVLEFVHQEHLDLTVPTIIMDIVSYFKFSDDSEESTLRAQHKALAARTIDVFNAAICPDKNKLDMDVMVKCYQAWARAPVCLDLKSSNRCNTFKSRQSLELLNIYNLEKSARATAPQAAALLVAMTAEYIKYEGNISRPHSNDIQYLYMVLESQIEQLSCEEMEIVAGAVEHLRNSFGRAFADCHTSLICALVKECMRRKQHRLAPYSRIASVLVNCIHSVSNKKAGNVTDPSTVREMVKKWRIYYRDEVAATVRY